MELLRIFSRPVPVTRALLVALFAVAILTWLLSSMMSDRFEEHVPYAAALAFGWKSNAAIDDGQYWRLITPIYLHAGIFHLAINGLAIHLVAPFIERVYGASRFFLIFMGAGLAGTVASYIWTDAPSVGASGAIFGCFGAILVFAIKFRREFPPQFSKRLIRSIAPIVLLNVGIGFVIPQIDNAAHLGGLAGGVLVAAILSSNVREARRGRMIPRVLAIISLLATIAAGTMILGEVDRCAQSPESFEVCYRAEFEQTDNADFGEPGS